jgi:hypothetical protein
MYDLERDGAVMSLIAGEVHCRHAAAPKLALDRIAASERRPQLRWRVMRETRTRLVDVRHERRREVWSSGVQKAGVGIRAHTIVDELLDLRPQIRVAARLIEERRSLALWTLERIGRYPFHRLPAIAIRHRGAPGTASLSP